MRANSSAATSDKVAVDFRVPFAGLIFDKGPLSFSLEGVPRGFMRLKRFAPDWSTLHTLRFFYLSSEKTFPYIAGSWQSYSDTTRSDTLSHALEEAAEFPAVQDNSPQTSWSTPGTYIWGSERR